MTGPLERPSQETSETRKAKRRADSRSAFVRVRVALRRLADADRLLLLAAQRAERSLLLASITARLGRQHTSRNAAAVALFASRRAAFLAIEDPAQRSAALARLDLEQTTELAALALAHAAEMRAARCSALLSLLPLQRDARRASRRASRRQQLGFAIVQRRRIMRPVNASVTLYPARATAQPPRRYRRRKPPQLRA